MTQNTIPKRLEQIARRALTLTERLNLSHELQSVASETVRETAPDVAEWVNTLCPGDPNSFVNRFAWNDLTIQQGYLAWDYSKLGTTTPDWTTILAKLCTTGHQHRSGFGGLPPTSGPAYLPTHHELPFQHLWASTVDFARVQVAERLNRPSDQLSPRLSRAAQDNLQWTLMQRLCSVTQFSLYESFTAEQPPGHRFLSALKLRTAAPASRQLYETFIERHQNDGLIQLFETYPMMGRLVATLLLQWIEGGTTFIEHVDADWFDIVATLAPGAVTVKQIHGNLSDPHNGGHTVSVLTLDTGTRIVYKPKPIALEKCFFDFVDWCNRLRPRSPLRTLTVLSKGEHGWVEYVAPEQSDDPTALHHFYSNTGALMAILYLLGGTDCHFENLIAGQDGLVLVDAETLLRPSLIPPEEAVNVAATDLSESVLSLGLLPYWKYSSGQLLAFDISALGHMPDAESAVSPGWSHLNTDTMAPGYRPAVLHTAHLPFSNAKNFDIYPYVDSLVDGFRDMYHLLEARKDALTSDTGPLQVFRQQQTRFVFRPTHIYSRIARQLCNPASLRDPRLFSLRLEQLARALLASDERPDEWPLLEAELASLTQGDIPLFTGNTDSCEIHNPSPGSNGIDMFWRSGFDRAQLRAKTLNEKDLEFQVGLIQGSIATRFEPLLGSISAERRIPDKLPELPRSELLDEADALGQQLYDHALMQHDGQYRWLGPQIKPASERFHLGSVGYGLYDGMLGILIFLAALDRENNTNRSETLATQLIDSQYDFLVAGKNRNQDRWLRSTGLGFASGLGGLLYGLSVLAHWNIGGKQVSALDLSTYIADRLDQDFIESDRFFDVLSGSSGCIIGLLALRKVSQDDRWLSLADRCGTWVAKNQNDNGGWSTIKARRPLTGFSHGAAGIAYALMRLYQCTGTAEYMRSAVKAFDYERSVFDEERQNWPDFREDETGQTFMNSWCHGAPGIALSRIGCLGIERALDGRLHEDTQLALATAQSTAALELDHLCCGNFGQAEILWIAGAQPNFSDKLQDDARRLVAETVIRKRRAGGYRFLRFRQPVFVPGFFQGTAGIGYQLVRMASRLEFPSILGCRFDTIKFENLAT